MKKLLIGLFLLAWALAATAFAQTSKVNEIVLTQTTGISFGLVIAAAAALSGFVGTWLAVSVKLARLEERLNFVCRTLDRHEEELCELNGVAHKPRRTTGG